MSEPPSVASARLHADVQAHLESTHSTRVAPQGEAHYSEWNPTDRTEHKKYDEIYNKMEGQDPHDQERYENIMHSPKLSTENKVNAIESMELPHTDQRCDLVNR